MQAYYKLSYVDKQISNPEQRICEDIPNLTKGFAELLGEWTNAIIDAGQYMVSKYARQAVRDIQHCSVAQNSCLHTPAMYGFLFAHLYLTINMHRHMLLGPCRFLCLPAAILLGDQWIHWRHPGLCHWRRWLHGCGGSKLWPAVQAPTGE